MGVFKKLKGNDVRVVPIKVQQSINVGGTYSFGPIPNYNPATKGGIANRINFPNPEDPYGTSNPKFYNSVRQLFYGAYISQSFISTGSVFSTHIANDVINESGSVFSKYDPCIQGCYTNRNGFPTEYEGAIGLISVPINIMGESLVPHTVVLSSGTTDDGEGNLITAGGAYVGNIFYDQGVIVLYGSEALGGLGSATGSYTIYETQYKCTAEAGEFNYSLNPTLLTGSNVEYDSDIINSPEFMPYVTTVGLYNENQELIMVGKLAKPVQLNPYTDTNFIIRIDK